MTTFLEPRSALIALAVPLLGFACQLVFIPDVFRSLYFVSPPPEDADNNTIDYDMATFFLRFWAMREMLLPLIFLAIAQDGSDKLCRMSVTCALVCLSPVQIYEMATNPTVKSEWRVTLLVSQGICAAYMAIVVFKAWTTTTTSKSSTGKEKD